MSRTASWLVFGILVACALALLALNLAHAGEVYPIERIVRTIDGDTLVADLTLGLGTLARRSIRLKDVCAQEMSEAGGPTAKLILEAALPARSPLSLEITGKSFDRLEGILRDGSENVNAHVQAMLVAAGVNGGRGVCP